MTKTVLTREDIQRDFTQVANLGLLFKALEERLERNGEVICQFKLNGLNLSESDESRLAQIDLSEIHDIEIDSQSPLDLLFNLLENWIKELPRLIKNADELSRDIKFNGLEGRFKSFVDLLDTCQFLMESLTSLDSMIQRSSIDQGQWKAAGDLTARAIGEALKIFELKDFVLLSEILEYDLGHALQIWFEEIQKLNAHLREENADDPTGFSSRLFTKRD